MKLHLTASEPVGGWTEEVLAAICAEVGLDPSGARLIKFTNNAVYSLASAPVIVRIPGSPQVAERVSKVVAVARWLADHNMPSVRLIEEVPQPLTIDGHPVTLWHLASWDDATPTGTDLGQILRRFHSLPSPPVELPQWRPIAGIRQRVAAEDILDPTDHALLVDRCDQLEARLEELTYFLPQGPIHGDSFVGNLIPSTDGSVICDFDSAAFGPREWDLTPVAVGKLRFEYVTDFHRQLATAYGVDVLRWPGFPVMRQLRELQLVTSVLPVLRSNRTLIDQWSHRFRTFRSGDLLSKWKTYS